jgi:hypothetical protein
VIALSDEQLDHAISHADPTIRGLLMGILQHNAYHAGQMMQILKTVAGKGP